PDAPHSLTHLPDLAQAMVYCARTATTLTAEAPGRSVVLHAPTDTAHSLRSPAARTAEHAGVRERRVIAVPRRLTALLGRVNTLMRELSGIADLWYGPCVLEPGVLTTVHGLQATPWAEATASTIAPPPRAAHGAAAAPPTCVTAAACGGRACSPPPTGSRPLPGPRPSPRPSPRRPGPLMDPPLPSPGTPAAEHGGGAGGAAVLDRS